MWFTLFVLACSEDTAPPAETFDATLQDLGDETARHGAEVAAAADLAAVTAAEDDYRAAGGEHRDEMGRCMDAFMACGMGMDGGMMSGSMDDWHGSMEDLGEAMDAHHGAMAGCGSLEDCQAMEEAWQAQVGDMLDHMEQMDPAWDEACAW